jgi:predicted Zn finger-like uncharacterized protein
MERRFWEKVESFTMILTCPQCATRYIVDDAEMRHEGRKVKCAACGEEWRVSADGEEYPPRAPLASPPAAAPVFEVVGQETSPRTAASAPTAAPPILESLFVAPINTDSKPAASKGPSLLSNLLLGVVILAVLTVAAFAFRMEIVRIAPNAAPIYSALGIPTKAPAPLVAKPPPQGAAPPHE